MIKNDRQYQVTKSRLKDFRDSAVELEAQELDPLLKELQLGAMKSQITDFEDEIKEYELLKDGAITYVYIDTISDFHEALIKARIARKWTHAELAKILELKEQQIQRYEMSNYSTASMGRIVEVATALDIEFGKIKIKVKEPGFTAIEQFGVVDKNLHKIKSRRSLWALAD